MKSGAKNVIASLFTMVVIMVIIGVGIFYGQSSSDKYNANIVGTFQETRLSITLNKDGTFSFYNGASYSSSSGKYTYTMSNDEKYAYVNLTVQSGSCSYTGGKNFSINNNVYFVPKIGIEEITSRTMTKVR